LNQFPTRFDVDALARNNGPEESGAGVFFDVEINEGSVFLRWIAQSGDLCFNDSDEQIVCQEGPPSNDPTVDVCLDGNDNDGDTLADLDDPDCGEVRAVRESVFLFPGSFVGTYERSFSVLCQGTGVVDIDIMNDIEVQEGYVDPNPANNHSQAKLQDECFLSKGGRSTNQASGESSPRPVPYFPSALPQTGGPP
jgi:hypothetical protein